jgi:hypothetical protein
VAINLEAIWGNIYSLFAAFEKPELFLCLIILSKLKVKRD